MSGQAVFTSVFDIITASKITQVYTDSGTGASKNLSVFQADLDAIPDNFYMIGQVAIPGYKSWTPGLPPSCVFLVKPTAEGVFKPPHSYEQVWTDRGSGGGQDGSFWRVIPPMGYTALGDVVVDGYNKPPESFTKKYACIKTDLLVPGHLGDQPLWTDAGSGAGEDGAIWAVQNTGTGADNAGLAGFFKVWNNYTKPTIPVAVLPAGVRGLPA